MTFIRYNEKGLVGIGLALGVHQLLVYWYKPKNRPYITYQNYTTNKYWRV